MVLKRKIRRRNNAEIAIGLESSKWQRGVREEERGEEQEDGRGRRIERKFTWNVRLMEWAITVDGFEGACSRESARRMLFFFTSFFPPPTLRLSFKVQVDIRIDRGKKQFESANSMEHLNGPSKGNFVVEDPSRSILSSIAARDCPLIKPNLPPGFVSAGLDVRIRERGKKIYI